VPDVGQRLGELFVIPGKLGPLRKFMDIHSPHVLRTLYPTFSALDQLFDAYTAENKRANLRIAYAAIVNKHAVA
jgi:hypothetical protein